MLFSPAAYVRRIEENASHSFLSQGRLCDIERDGGREGGRRHYFRGRPKNARSHMRPYVCGSFSTRQFSPPIAIKGQREEGETVTKTLGEIDAIQFGCLAVSSMYTYIPTARSLSLSSERSSPGPFLVQREGELAGLNRKASVCVYVERRELLEGERMRRQAGGRTLQWRKKIYCDGFRPGECLSLALSIDRSRWPKGVRTGDANFRDSAIRVSQRVEYVSGYGTCKVAWACTK